MMSHEIQPMGRLETSQCFNNSYVTLLVTANLKWVRNVETESRYPYPVHPEP